MFFFCITKGILLLIINYMYFFIIIVIKSLLNLILIDEASADRLFRLEKKEGTIQYIYRTWGTHARVFSLTLAHENSKNEIRQRNR